VTDLDREVEDVLRNLAHRAGQVQLHPRVEDLGRVRRVGDGVAVVDGLVGVTADELVMFTNGVRGQVFDLDRTSVGCVLLGPEEGITADSIVVRTGRQPEMPVGPAVLGRVVDALGQPRDGGGPIAAVDTRLVEQEAPGPLDRQPVREPLLTGIKVIDAAIPVGRGQRQLIVGDRKTGKTSIALDAIINQRTTGVVCVYVSIGSKRAAVIDVVEELRRHEALSHTAVIMADATDPAPLRYLAAYAGCTLAEWFAYQGGHALIVYDDLSRHAESYRDVSLILRRPPGREAYPGDIFSAHARLMERSFKLSDRLGGGSVTALPLVETQRGNISGFIPTNVISMTDGQVYLDAALFSEGQLPAVNVGMSVSRVGRDAQPEIMRQVAANVRLSIAQYEDVKSFARFGALLDEATNRQINRGERLVRVLGQTERATVTLAVQVAELWALNAGLLDDVPPEAIGAFEQQLSTSGEALGALQDRLAAAPALNAALERELREWIGRARSIR